MPRYDSDSEIWRFETARFVVTCNVEPEDSDPADHFCDKRDVRFARKGGAAWFTAVVNVWLKPADPDAPTYAGDPPGTNIAWDYLGCCSYRSWSDFTDSHRDRDPMNRNCSIMRAKRGPVVICHYFPGMVTEAARLARTRLAELDLRQAA